MNTPKKEMKKLSRTELLEIIYEMKKNEEKLKTELAAAQEELKEQKIKIDNAGSIAQAALSLNNVFESAQQAADKYVKTVEERCADMEAKNAASEIQGQELLDEAHAKADEIIREAEAKSAQMIETAQEEIKEREIKFRQTVDKVLDSNLELKALVKRDE